MIMGPNGDCFAVARIFVLFCRHPFAGEASAEFSITSLLVNRPPEKKRLVWRYHYPDLRGRRSRGFAPNPTQKTF